MLRSSLGFHTLTLSYPLFFQKVQYLISDFKRYSEETGAIQIYRDHGNLRIEFCSRAVGIGWLIRYKVQLENLKMSVDMVEVKINPKILGGIHDYITAATYDDMETAIANFNQISANISPGLGRFEQYRLKRIDYCVNFALNELVPDCTHEQIMSLIKRSDIPPHYEEWKEYDSVSHRTKTRPGSFYLMNKSVHINCYSKYIKLQEQSQKNLERGYPPVPQAIMDAAKDIIRFEIQCKYPKTYALSHQLNGTVNNYTNQKYLLSDLACIDIIDKYYDKTIGRGFWHTLQDAITLTKSHHYNSQKEKRLIDALNLVSSYRSVAKAKAALQGHDLEVFKQSLSDLPTIGINPVTIPREWGIRRIPDLLGEYIAKVSEERRNKQWEDELLRDYFKNPKKFRKKSGKKR